MATGERPTAANLTLVLRVMLAKSALGGILAAVYALAGHGTLATAALYGALVAVIGFGIPALWVCTRPDTDAGTALLRLLISIGGKWLLLGAGIVIVLRHGQNALGVITGLGIAQLGYLLGSDR